MRRLVTSVLAVLALGAVAACGADSGSNTTSEGLEKINVGIIPTVDVAPLYLAQEKGIFAEHGLEVELKEVQTGAASTAAVMSGEYQFGFAAPVPEIQAQDKGLPLVVVAGAIAQGEPLSQAILVKKDSGIKDVSDLAGKSVAVNALQAVNDLVMRAYVQKEGGNPDDIKFIALPYPDMQAALDSGRIDAAFLIEPFLSNAVAAGNSVVVENPQGALVGDGTTFSTYFATKQYVSEDAATVKKFVDAVTEANEYAQENPDEVRKIIPTFTAISPEVAEKMALADYETAIDHKTFEVLGKFMKDFGWIKKEPDLDTLIN